MLTEAEFSRLVAEVRQQDMDQRLETVRGWYGSTFTPEGISTLSREMFKRFLSFNGNLHWIGICRHSNEVTEDMPRLREALSVVLDESKPVGDRINDAKRMVRGLGAASISAFLLVSYPSRYGVYNYRSRKGLRKLGRHPEAQDPGFLSRSLGDQYESVNRVLNDLATTHSVSLWALDYVWGAVEDRTLG